MVRFLWRVRHCFPVFPTVGTRPISHIRCLSASTEVQHFFQQGCCGAWNSHPSVPMNCSPLGSSYSIFMHHLCIFLIVFEALFVLYPKGRSHQVECGDVVAFWSSSKHPSALFVGVGAGGLWGQERLSWCCNNPFPVFSGAPSRQSRNNPLPAGQHPLHLWQVPWAGFRCKLMLGSRTPGAWLCVGFQCAHLIPCELWNPMRSWADDSSWKYSS